MSATRFIVVRHCEAQGNIRRVFNGITDGDITENGARQLDLLAARMAEEHFDVIYSSPLRRSVKTAQACNRAHRLPIHILNSLIEINGGAFEGLPFADFPKCYPRESALWNDEPHAFAIEKGESMQQVFDRMRDAVLLLAARHPGKTVLLASHGCAIRNLLCWAHGWPIERLNDVNWGENTCVSVFEVEESGTPLLEDNKHKRSESDQQGMDPFALFYRKENRYANDGCGLRRCAHRRGLLRCAGDAGHRL